MQYSNMTDWTISPITILGLIVLGYQIVCERFTAPTLLWSLEFQILKKSQVQKHQNIIFIFIFYFYLLILSFYLCRSLCENSIYLGLKTNYNSEYYISHIAIYANFNKAKVSFVEVVRFLAKIGTFGLIFGLKTSWW